MKPYIISIFFVVLAPIGIAQYNEIQDFCTSAETKSKAKELLGEYKYDASKLTRITFKNKPQTKEIEVPLYFGEDYRFVFSIEGAPEPINIKVYNKSFDAKKRDLLWEAKPETEGQTEFVWEPEKSRKVYVSYDIPATSGDMKKGCAVFVVGYKIK